MSMRKYNVSTPGPSLAIVLMGASKSDSPTK